MRKILFILSYISFAIPSLSQTLTPRVICSGYGSGQGGGIKLNYTIGETFVTTLRSGGTVLTQGFHQPEINPVVQPSAICPNDSSLQCIIDIPALEFSNLEGSTFQVNVLTSDNIIASTGCAITLIRTWTVEFNNGQTNYSQVCTATYTILDTTAPALISISPDASIECSAFGGVQSIPDATFTDNCAGAPVVTESYTESMSGCDHVITISWTATDACGNQTTARAQLTIYDHTSPVFTYVPAGGTFSCEQGINFRGEAEADDNCEVVTISHSDNIIEGNCENAYTIVRTWTATDACGNASSAQTVYEVVDQTAPYFTSVPSDITVACDSQIPATVASAADACDSDVTVTYQDNWVSGDNNCSRVYERVYTAVDNCGHAVTASHLITVIDNVAPVFEGTPSITLSCGEVNPYSIYITASDNCGTVNIDVLYDEPTITGCGSYVRHYGAYDNCGNSSYFNQTIYIVDDVAPVASVEPDDYTVECGQAWSAAEVTFTDNCNGILNETNNVVTNGNSCSMTYIFIWTATDACGNTTTVDQVITVEDNTAPVLEVPASYNVECNIDVFFESAQATDNCSAEVSIVESIDTIRNGCSISYVRTFTATDVCGNVSVGTQTINVIDTTSPSLNNCPNDIQLPLTASIPAIASITASDNCDADVSITYSETCIGCAGSSSNTMSLLTPVRPAANTCLYPYDWAMALFSLPSQYRWYQLDTAVPATMVDSNDSTLTLTGRVFNVLNPSAGFDFNVTYAHGMDWATWSTTGIHGFKADCGGVAANHFDWMYYIMQSSAATELTGWGDYAGTQLQLTHAPSNQYFGLQVGQGANNYNNVNAAGGWFLYSGQLLVNGQPVNSGLTASLGDFAFELKPDETRTIIRNWTATDDCGNTSTCSQTINFAATNNCNGVDIGTSCDDNNSCTINDVIGADCTCAGTFADSDQDGVCNADDLCFGPEPGSGCNDNNPCTVNDIVGVDCVCAGTSADDDHDNICNALDPCLGVPIAANTPQNLSVSCNQEIPDFNPAFYMADGSEVFLTHTASVVNEGCQTRVIEVWTATNSCNEFTSVYRTVTQTDDTAPVLEGIPADRTVACQSAENTLVYPTATDDCSATEISYTYERIDGDCPNNYTKHYVFTAVDACGNSSSEEYNVYVRDQIAPIIETYGIDGRQISCIGEIANRPFTATDNCSDVSLSYSMIDYMVGSFHIVETTCQAVDACGNTSYEVIVDTTALGNVGSPCDDGLYCTTNDVVTSDCSCVGSLIDNNGNYICDFIDNFTISVNSLSFCPGETITLAVSQPITGLNYFWSNNASGTSIQVSPAQSATYSVSTVIDGQTLHASVNLIALPVNVFYADTDGDGYGNIQNAVNSCQSTLLGYVMNSSDCNDSNANVFIGASCDDNDPCTANDIISADCSCAGIFADSDNDGTCDANDLCVGPEPGAACDDGDECTINDTVQADCTCVGTFVDTDEDGTCDAYDVCFGPEPGSRCEDGNPCTFNEKVTEDCTCVGELYVPSVGQQTAFACGSYQWNGNTYSLSGDYEFHSPTATGCDSTTVLHLTIAQPTSSSSSASACGSYQWNGNTYTQSGTYTYLSTNAAGCQHTSSLNLTINILSTAPTAANASQTTVSAGASVTLTVSGGALGTGAQWKWYKGSCGGTLVGTGASITTAVSATTTYYVRAEGTCNTTACASVIVTVQTAVCGPQSVLASATTICSGSSTTLSVVGSTGTGGTWKWYKNGCGSGTAVGTGATLTVSPTANTTYYVRSEGGSCGITTCLSVVINVNAPPAKPGEITGLSSGLCNRQSVVYSVGNCTGASSYQWTVPSGVTIISGQGTASITVNFSASIGTNNSCGSSSICVRSGNSCGWSAYQCLELRLAPTAPSSISGNSAPCRNQVNTYTIAAVSGATSYVWAVPSGCTIQSGQGTTSINVMVGSTSGNVTVTAVNACGQSTQATKSIRPKSCATAMPMLLELWPNPTSERVFFAHGENTPELLEIYDMLGRDIYRGQWIGEFDVTGLASGIYFVRATYAGESEVKRMEVVK